jgi:hypothetical protein
MKGLCLFFVSFVLFFFSIQAQVKNKRHCDTSYALGLVQQQIDDSKAIESSDKRVRMIVRAADFFWAFDEEKARAMFTDALNLAKARYKEKGREESKDGRLGIVEPDYRFMVLNSIAKRDSKWAKSLIEETLKEVQEDAKENAAKKKSYFDETFEITNLAISLIETDINNALNFARMSLRYPIHRYGLPYFISRLAIKNQAIADGFYSEALNSKSNAPIKEILYLSAYPFGFSRIVGPEAMQVSFVANENFVPNKNLQRLFINLLIQRAASVSTKESEIATNVSLQSDVEHLFIAFFELESFIAENFPDDVERTARAKQQLNLLLTPDARRRAIEIDKERTQAKIPEPTLEERIEAIAKETNVNKRDFLYALLLLNSKNDDELLKKLEPLIDKIADSDARRQVSDYYNFQRAANAIKDNRLEEAAKFTEKVSLLEQRAGLSFEIAEASLKNNNDRERAIEILDEASKAAMRTDYSLQRARTLLGVAYLYEQFDHQRALDRFEEAIKSINKLDNPNLSASNVNRKVEMKWGAFYRAYNVPGYNLENTVLALSKDDFDGMLLKTKDIQDRFLRIIATITIVSDCIEQPKKPKNKTAKTKTQ